MVIVPRTARSASDDARHNIDLACRQDQVQIPKQLAAFLETALGLEVAAIHLAWVRALARANPHIAESFLTEELRRWRSWTATINPAQPSSR